MRHLHVATINAKTGALEPGITSGKIIRLTQRRLHYLAMPFEPEINAGPAIEGVPPRNRLRVGAAPAIRWTIQPFPPFLPIHLLLGSRMLESDQGPGRQTGRYAQSNASPARCCKATERDRTVAYKTHLGGPCFTTNGDSRLQHSTDVMMVGYILDTKICLVQPCAFEWTTSALRGSSPGRKMRKFASIPTRTRSSAFIWAGCYAAVTASPASVSRRIEMQVAHRQTVAVTAPPVCVEDQRNLAS